MKSLSLKLYFLLFLGLVISYVFLGLFIVHSTSFLTHSDLFSLAITFDLCLGLPVLFYFLIVKKRQWDALLTVIALVPAIGIASLILPKDNHYYLKFAIQSLVITEGGLFIYGILKIRKIIASYRIYAHNSTDFIGNIERSLADILGGSSLVTHIVASEFAMLYYSLFFWRAKADYTEGASFFTVHKKVGYGIILAVLSMGGFLEIFGMHVFIAKYSTTGALVLTILSIYSILFIIADFVAMSKRPIFFEKDVLKFRVGLRWSAEIPISEIVDCQLIKNFKKDKSVLNAAIIGNPNCLIVLKNPIVFTGIYGIRRIKSSVVFNVDNEKAFVEILKELKK
jgi:hypothetical protein